MDTAFVYGSHGLRIPFSDKKDVGFPKDGRVKHPLGTWKLDFSSNQPVQIVKPEQDSDFF